MDDKIKDKPLIINNKTKAFTFWYHPKRKTKRGSKKDTLFILQPISSPK